MGKKRKDQHESSSSSNSHGGGTGGKGKGGKGRSCWTSESPNGKGRTGAASESPNGKGRTAASESQNANGLSDSNDPNGKKLRKKLGANGTATAAAGAETNGNAVENGAVEALRSLLGGGLKEKKSSKKSSKKSKKRPCTDSCWE